MTDEWTFNTLLWHLEMLINERTTQGVQRAEAIERTLAALSLHFNSMESDLHRDIDHIGEKLPMMMSRDEYDSHHRDLVRSVDNISARVTLIEGQKEGSGDIRALVFSVMAALGSIGAVITAVVLHR